jgi:hypothetical protein
VAPDRTAAWFDYFFADGTDEAWIEQMLEFDNQVGAEDTVSPYSVSWDTTTASDGAHSLTAVARDAAGNTSTSTSVSVTVSNAPPPPTGSCPCTVWLPAATPSRIETTDNSAVELGVRFRADVNGTITGVRFYKGAGNTGTHTGSLWTNAGALLATATFINETASGWQQVNFSSPVAITANTTYVVSYHTNTGNYGVTDAYFAAAGVDNAPLHALQNGVGGSNAVYRYGASAFPPIPGKPRTTGSTWCSCRTAIP